jgi:predicted metal-dependent phosphoesterase TrpH
MRCDLHVHTDRSGMCTIPLLNRICRESYSDPLEVYSALKQRGMDLVTVTDHDSIDAAERLRRFPDFFPSEEVSCTTAEGTSFHLGVYDISERDHVEIQRRREDVPSLVAYLDERSLFFSINHVFSGLTGRRTDADFTLFQEFFPGVETQNGQMPAACNREAQKLAARWGKAAVGGSDAHTLSSLGQTFTNVPGARNKAEFLAGLKSGRSVPAGHSGNYAKLTIAVMDIGMHLVQEHPWVAVFLPLALALPAVTLFTCSRDFAFAHWWSRRLAERPLLKTALACSREEA